MAGYGAEAEQDAYFQSNAFGRNQAGFLPSAIPAVPSSSYWHQTKAPLF